MTYNFTVEYYERNDPFRIFIFKTDAEDVKDAENLFRQSPRSTGCIMKDSYPTVLELHEGGIYVCDDDQIRKVNRMDERFISYSTACWHQGKPTYVSVGNNLVYKEVRLFHNCKEIKEEDLVRTMRELGAANVHDEL